MHAASKCPACQTVGSYQILKYEEPVNPWLTVMHCSECGYVHAVYEKRNGIPARKKSKLPRSPST